MGVGDDPCTILDLIRVWLLAVWVRLVVFGCVWESLCVHVYEKEHKETKKCPGSGPSGDVFARSLTKLSH